MADDQMRKVDFVKDKKLLNAATQEWIKLVEKQNIERVEKLRKIRKKNIITSLFLGGGVLAIYAYTILSVKQETFLDDFEVPQIVPKKEEN
ncbi:cytochrome c oxidase assembly factor 3, mitochondrial [Macrosteles quadrilineatus]|uniref:cytochrome c oxidase assembly factor 3, mitochondrial n=1 Tax=Macrosteles quadrilineatus TaxID=74068 RepID=UPI0023E16EB9|nr:cytochrome c oxidase assembly factor 3, mitochondrial [Macrosteles quadrilineatus]